MPEIESVCTVVSYVPFDIREDKPGLLPGRFFIPASRDKIPQLLVIRRSIHYVYLDETRGSLQVRDAAEEVARSVVEDYCNSQLALGEDARPALFFVMGAPSISQILQEEEKQIAELLIKQHNWFLKLARLADDDWNQHGRHNVISSFQRIAAKEIGWKEIDHKWLGSSSSESTTRVICKACSQPVMADTVVCPNCRCILDPAKHKLLAFA